MSYSHRMHQTLCTFGGAVSILPLSLDFSTLPDGVLAGWTGSGAVASGVFKSAPTLGAEIFTDPGIEAWTTPTNATSWTENLTGSTTINQETSVIHGGSNAARIDVDASNNNGYLSQQKAITIDVWYSANAWVRVSSTASTPLFIARFADNVVTSGRQLTTSYVQHFWTMQAPANNNVTMLVGRSTNCTSKSVYLDDISIKPITLSTLFNTRNVGDSDVDIRTTPTITTGTQAGLVLNLDSTTSPQNFVVCYYDRNSGKVMLEKTVGGVKQAALINTTTAYVAGAVLRVVKSNTTYQVFYGGSQVGTDQTISDVGIISNKIHGLFSTHADTSFGRIDIL